MPLDRARLTREQRRRLTSATLIVSGLLLILTGLALRAQRDLPHIPAAVPFVTTPDEVSDWPASALASPPPAPTRQRLPVLLWLWPEPPSGLPEDEVGERSAPVPSRLFLPLLSLNPIVREEIVVVPEPAPVEPVPEWPAGRASLTSSKLGLHVTWNNDPWIMEFIRRARPRVVKAVDDVGWLADVKQASPNTITLGRFNNQDESVVFAKDPVAAADEYIAANLDRYRANPGVDYWEGWNEFVPVNNERLAWYAAFEARRACRMAELGLRAAVGGFSVGVPEYSQMRVFMPALEAAYQCNGIFTLHEYNSPTMWCGTEPSRPGLIPGAPDFGDVLVGYHALRYRFWYEGYLKPIGMGDLPLVISEAGVEGRPDAGGPCNDPGGRAWKSYDQHWLSNGFGPTAPDAYVSLLAWYDQQMRQDSYVWGATVFTAGARDGNDRWNPFDLHEVLVPLSYYLVGQP